MFCSIITALKWSQTSSILYFGTETGTIYTLWFQELNSEVSKPTFDINELKRYTKCTNKSLLDIIDGRAIICKYVCLHCKKPQLILSVH